MTTDPGGAHHRRDDPLHSDFLFGTGAPGEASGDDAAATDVALPVVDTGEWDDDPPTIMDVKNGFAAARAEASATQEIVDQFPKQMRRIASDAGKEAGAEAGKSEGRKFGLIALAVALIVAILVSIAAWSVATRAMNVSAAAQVAADSAQQQVDAALARLGEANGVLQARGQRPVAAPPAADPAEAIAAAVLAQVLADLPASPTAEQIATRLQTTVTANVLGPTLDALTGEVAAYFAANPVRPPAPSEAQIRAAVDASLAQNPPEQGPQGEPCSPSIPACVGPQGDQGPAGDAGRSVLSGPQPVRLDDGSCVFRVTYDQAPTVVDYPAGDTACPGPVSDPTTTAPPPTGVEGPQGLAGLLGR